MSLKLQSFIHLITGSKELLQKDKDALVTTIKNIEKEQSLSSIKLSRLEKEKRTLTILLEETIDELEQKKKAIEHKNRELEIETSLEKVRVAAMGMYKPDDLLNICEVFFKELVALGFKNIRNALIHIFNDEKGYFYDYDYSDFTRGKITHLPYKSNAAMEKFLEEVRKSDDAFVEVILEGKELTEWKKFRKKSDQIHDERIYKAKQLNYYFYSIGAGNIGLSTFGKITSDQLEILKRFRNVFDFSYRRYLDIEKAEAQTRETQIELGLERVRARAMAMHSSTELREVVQVLFEKLRQMDFVFEDGAVSILVFKEGSKDHVQWSAGPGQDYATAFEVPYTDHSIPANLIHARESGVDFFSKIFPVEEKNDYFRYLFEHTNYRHLPDVIKELIFGSKHYGYSVAFAKKSAILIPTNSGRLIPEDKKETLKRFANAFDQAFIRFLDLQKAEAQAREAQIEAALERVRAKAMAMHSSEGLTETIRVFYQQISLLNGTPQRCGVSLFDKETHNSEFTSMYTTEEGESVEIIAKLNLTGHPILERMYEHWLLQKEYHPVLRGNEIKEYYEFIRPQVAFPNYSHDDVQYGYYFFFTEGTVYAWTEEELTEEELQIYRKFTTVLSLTYKRYKDLKLAEAQTRETQIELALERVRARTMAMQKSHELPETSKILFQQMKELGEPVEQCTIGIIREEENVVEISATLHGASLQKIYLHNMNEPFVMNKVFKAWKAQQKTLQIELQGEELNAYNKYRNELTGSEIFPTDLSNENKRIIYCAFFSKGMLALGVGEPRPPESLQLLKRFASVFDLTYTRFLDLQKAEAQAREAQIELALERVRARTMAMQKSEELSETSFVLFQQLKELGVVGEQISIGIFKEAERVMELYATIYGNQWKDSARVQFDKHEVHRKTYAAWKEQKKSLVVDLSGEALDDYNRFKMEESPNQYKSKEGLPKGRWVMHIAFFSKGGLYFSTHQPHPKETIQLLERFASVFDLTYTRFSDLQKAEAQAREARIEASLERVRSKAMAMHSSQDLADTIGVFYNELQSFSITPRRCGVGLLNKESRTCELFTWITTEDGHSLELVGRLKMEGHPVLDNVYEHWLTQTEYHPVLRGKEISQYYQVIRPQVPFPNYNHDDVQYGYFFFFPEGGVYAWTADEMGIDELTIYRRFTSVLSLTYKRYKDLQQAEALAQKAKQDLVLLKEEKQRTEQALTELQVTQKQLIQSEKMASLGELTAGIAHEIQNPLNFVNNFSETNIELIEEMEEELGKGNISEAQAIANDLKENEEKINHHGKRADAIVKGMLQHSRKSTGQKEPTDINTLTDEYLRLSYHGLRAKNKGFNAVIQTNFDDSIGKINVAPQDIGRVLLNLFNNAFYSVNEKSKQLNGVFEPNVSVSTRMCGNTVQISVKDNGVGISEKAVEKIYQPFFTTKPVGEGTGLGLSLSYDIITKGHGGELKVDTKQGEGAEFIIEIPIEKTSKKV